jgi:hypothetical protein
MPYKLNKRDYYFKRYKCEYGHSFGSDAFRRACWRTYLGYLRGTDDPQSDSDVLGWLENIASEKVNNPKSKFYIYG